MKKILLYIILFFFSNSFSQTNDSDSNSWYTNLEKLSRFQEGFPCQLLNTNLRWTNSLEDVKDILIMQLLIQEDRYEDLQSFLDTENYMQQDNTWIKVDDRGNFEIQPVITLQEVESEGHDNLGLRVRFLFTDINGDTVITMNQPSTNAIYILLGSLLAKGELYSMIGKRKDFYIEENKKLKVDGLDPKSTIVDISKTEFNVINNETGDVENIKASNTLGLGNNPTSQQFWYFYKDNRTIPTQYVVTTLGEDTSSEDTSCIDNNYYAIWYIESIDAPKINDPLDIISFKSLKSLNQVIWMAED